MLVDLGHKSIKCCTIYFGLTLAEIASLRTMNLPPGIVTVGVSVSTIFIQVVTVDIKHVLHWNGNENWCAFIIDSLKKKELWKMPFKLRAVSEDTSDKY